MLLYKYWPHIQRGIEWCKEKASLDAPNVSSSSKCGEIPNSWARVRGMHSLDVTVCFYAAKPKNSTEGFSVERIQTTKHLLIALKYLQSSSSRFVAVTELRRILLQLYGLQNFARGQTNRIAWKEIVFFLRIYTQRVKTFPSQLPLTLLWLPLLLILLYICARFLGRSLGRSVCRSGSESLVCLFVRSLF